MHHFLKIKITCYISLFLSLFRNKLIMISISIIIIIMIKKIIIVRIALIAVKLSVSWNHNVEKSISWLPIGTFKYLWIILFFISFNLLAYIIFKCVSKHCKNSIFRLPISYKLKVFSFLSKPTVSAMFR